jgi:uncharacterized membrane protein
MKELNIFILARILHIIGIILWIGGVGFVTTVLIPSLKRITDKGDRLDLFEKLEGKFALQAKVSTLITGVTGIYMLFFLNAWDRYLQIQYWWIHLMTLIWLIFTIVLFILEPLFLHRWFKEQATIDSDNSFKWLHRFHIVLFVLSVIAIIGGMAGSHGYTF